MSKLVKQFKRELKKNPQKVGLLGLLVVVACWFWGPLIMPSSNSPRPTPKPAAAAAVALTPAATSSAEGSSAVIWRWQDLDARLSEDVRMRSVTPSDARTENRNPFVASQEANDLDAAVDALIAEVLADDEAERLVAAKAAAEKAAAETPAYFDRRPLYLTSTIVGSGKRRAIINGRAYAEGATMGMEDGREIILTSVAERRAVVEWNGHRRELKILRPGESGAE